MLFYQIQQFAVEFMSMPVGILYICPAGIKYAKITPEIPKGIPNPVL